MNSEKSHPEPAGHLGGASLATARNRRTGGLRLVLTAGAATALVVTFVPATPATATTEATATAAAVAHARKAVADRASSLGVNGEQALKVKDVVVDKDGTEHVRFDRTYDELPVLGGDFVVHLSPSGTFLSADRATRHEITVPTTTPSVTVSKAGDLAKLLLKSALSSGSSGSTGTPESTTPVSPKADSQLVVDALHGTPRLAWRTEATAKDTRGNPVAREVISDARTGAEIDSWNSLESATGTGHSLYSGDVNLPTTQSGSSYTLSDATRGGTYTGDARNGTDLCVLGVCVVRAPADVMGDADNSWGNGATSDRATAAVDAQYGTDMTWDYYRHVHGRLGIAGDGKGSYNRVHYGRSYNNAFWDDSCFCMTYGDGDGTSLGPLVSLDVAGHEMSHGVTSSTAGLTYSGESGGLNEATSDIFGTLVEFYADNPSDPGDFFIGEEVAKPGLGAPALRFMDDPSRDGQSVSCWTAATKDLDVHYSSGVANHFAYLLAEGSGSRTVGGLKHSSPTCDGSTINGIGHDKLGAIWYRALTVHMTSSTDYAGARTATLAAARDLYGAGSTEYDTVAAAWSAVGVG